MPKIKVNGLEISYRRLGKEGSAKGTVIFLHGAAQSSVCWEYQFEFCRSYTRYETIIPDLPGHGDSEGKGYQSIEDYSDFLSEFISRLKLKEIILVGHSMGGRISQVYTLNNPSRVTGMVLVGTGARIRVTRATLQAAEKDFKTFCSTAARNSFSKFATNDLRKEFQTRLENSSQETCVNDLIACNEVDVKDEVGEIEVPTLIVAGREDILAPVKHSQFLYKKIPNSKLEVIEKAGHFMMMERPDEFNKLLGKFLDFL